MKTYLVKYSTPEGWVPFMILAPSIYEGLGWVHKHIQERGICIDCCY